MHNRTLRWLENLLERDFLPASSVSGMMRGDVERLLQTGLVSLERSGRGKRYRPENRDAVERLLKNREVDSNLEDVSPKARAVALHGDAHKGREDVLLLLLSGTKDAVWSNGTVNLSVADQVNKYGIASLVVRPGDKWQTNSQIALVENQDLVLYGRRYFEKIGFKGTALYYSGWLSRALREWLNEFPRTPSVVVFPDYDIVGLNNYLIAKEHLKIPVSLYIPDNLSEMLRKYGDPNRLSTKSDRSHIERSDDPQVRFVYQKLLEAGRGLHQEGLLL